MRIFYILLLSILIVSCSREVPECNDMVTVVARDQETKKDTIKVDICKNNAKLGEEIYVGHDTYVIISTDPVTSNSSYYGEH